MAIGTTVPSWPKNLERDGFCVVPSVIPIDICQEFQESALTWLESFDRGFKRDNTSTWTSQSLPRHFAGGLYACHGVNHEAWVWKIRSQLGIQKVFAEVWGTSDLIVSFDACNITLPVNPKGRTDIETTKPWPHIDQNPRLVDKRLEVQGIANMYHSGPDDGGLVVMKGSHLLHRPYFDSIGAFQHEQYVAGQRNGHDYDIKELDWYLDHGGEIVKVCANEGDLILWDSRTIHWNASPTGSRIRFASYVAYSPRSLLDEAELKKRLDAFRKRIPTGHAASFPDLCFACNDEAHFSTQAKIPTVADIQRRSEQDRNDGATVTPVRPRHEPEESEVILRAVGVMD